MEFDTTKNNLKKKYLKNSLKKKPIKYYNYGKSRYIK